MIKLATATGEEHGLINVLPNSCKDNGFEGMTPENRAKCQKLRKEDAKKVKARYINHRGMHERLSRPYCRWAGDAIELWHLIPGHTYELPMGFVNEVNESLGLANRGEQLQEDGTISKDRITYEKLHELVPISF